MIDLHGVEHHALAAHHVVVIVGGEVSMQPVRGLGALAVADVVGQDYEVFRNVLPLAGAEQHIGENGIQQRVRIAAGAMQQEDGVIDVAGSVALRRAEGEVVELELRQRLAGAEAEIGKDGRAIHGGPLGRRAGAAAGGFAGGRDMV